MEYKHSEMNLAFSEELLVITFTIHLVLSPCLLFMITTPPSVGTSVNRGRPQALTVAFIGVYSESAFGDGCTGQIRLGIRCQCCCTHTSPGLRVHVFIYINKLFSTEDQPDSCKSLDSGCFCLRS